MENSVAIYDGKNGLQFLLPGYLIGMIIKHRSALRDIDAHLFNNAIVNLLSDDAKASENENLALCRSANVNIKGTRRTVIDFKVNVSDFVYQEIRKQGGEWSAYEASTALEKALQSILPEDLGSPSKAQLSFACDIANTMNTNLPAEARISMRACGEFIDLHKEDASVVLQEKKDQWSNARQCIRGAMVQYLGNAGEDIAAICQIMGVKRLSTIERYLDALEECRQSMRQYGEEERNKQLALLGEALNDMYPGMEEILKDAFCDSISSHHA